MKCLALVQVRNERTFSGLSFDSATATVTRLPYFGPRFMAGAPAVRLEAHPI